jgi:hypothetical protein
MNIYVAIAVSALAGASLALLFFCLYIKRMDKMMVKSIEESMKRQVSEAEQTLGQVAVVISGKEKGAFH